MLKPKSNVFDLSHDVKLSLNMGELVPVMVMECVPGDNVSLSCDSLLRFSPMLAPIMHRINCMMHYYFVPNRIIWENWDKFITNTVDDVTELPYEFPTFAVDPANAAATYSRLADYLGIPTPPAVGTPEIISALPFAAYQAIYNEYYRDQNLVTEVDYHLIDGDNTATYDVFGVLRKRAWMHDYFTACLPFAQKGPTVDIPLGDVVFDASAWPGVANPMMRDLPTGNIGPAGAIQHEAGGNIEINGDNLTYGYDPSGTLVTTPTTINDLRRAFRLQEWFERNARGGTRYIEHILAHFGVRSSDKRMQRPEYITGTKSPVQISEVLNTTGTEDAPQGEMAGHGISVTTGKYGKYFCEEHGYIIGIMSVMPVTAYQQGIPKHFTKHTDFTEYYWPSFAHLGEQEVVHRELYAYDGLGSQVFGYIPRYSEYKYLPSRVAGDFRDTLNFWHLGRIFDDPPVLNQEFIECTPADRIFAVTDPDIQKLYAHVYNKVKAVRPMPLFGTPTI